MEPSGLEPGAELGKYRLDRLLGRGGMGEVWAAHDPDLDRNVALKILRPALHDDRNARARLLREGRAMARLRHPNVITVHDAITTAGRDVIVMELVDGESMAEWIARPQRRRDIIEALLAAGRGLAAAHDAGMIHRDFKPHNILIERGGRVLVTDFGLARATLDATLPERAAAVPRTAPSADTPVTARAGPVELADTLAATPSGDATMTAPPSGSRAPIGAASGALDSELTRTGTLLGTPAYMAPELHLGETADERADQFAFCVTAWQALTGARPFPGGDLASIAAAIDAGPVGGDKLPRRLRGVLRRGLAHARAARWPKMTALLRAFERAWRRPRSIAMGGGAIAVAVGAAVAIGVVATGDDARDTCADRRASMARVWSPALREQLVSGKGLAELQDQLGPFSSAMQENARTQVAIVDRWVDEWYRVDAASCAKPSSAAALAELSCLESLRDQLGALVGLRESIPQLTIMIGWASRSLPWPTICQRDPRGVVATMPDDPAKRDEARKLAHLIFSVNAIHSLELPGATTESKRIDEVLQKAKVIGHPPLLAEAFAMRATATAKDAATAAVSGDADANALHERAFAEYGEALEHAESSGHRRVAARALLGQIEAAQVVPSLRGEVDELLRRAIAVIERLDDPMLMPALARVRAAVGLQAGRWTEAIEQANHATVPGVDEKTRRDPRAALVGARALVLRHAPGDLEIADKMLTSDNDGGEFDTAILALDAASEIQRAWIAWRGGKEPVAVEHLSRFTRSPSNPFELNVRALDAAGRPVPYIQVIAAADPAVFGPRMVLDRGPMVLAEATSTGMNAIATIEAPRRGIVIASASDGIAIAPVPRGNTLALTLAAPATLTGTVAGLPPASAVDPVDASARAARRSLGVAVATIQIAGAPVAFAAPVEPTGAWKITGLPAGRYDVTVEVTSSLGDVQLTRTTAALRAGETRDVARAFVPPLALEVITRPAIDGLVVAVPGTAAPRTLAEHQAWLRPARRLAIVRAGPPSTRVAVGGARIGDGRTWLAAEPGPVTACVIPGAVPTALPPAHEYSIAAAGAPRCRTIHVAPGAASVVIPTTAP